MGLDSAFCCADGLNPMSELGSAEMLHEDVGGTDRGGWSRSRGRRSGICKGLDHGSRGDRVRSHRGTDHAEPMTSRRARCWRGCQRAKITRGAESVHVAI